MNIGAPDKLNFRDFLQHGDVSLGAYTTFDTRWCGFLDEVSEIEFKDNLNTQNYSKKLKESIINYNISLFPISALNYRQRLSCELKLQWVQLLSGRWEGCSLNHAGAEKQEKRGNCLENAIAKASKSLQKSRERLVDLSLVTFGGKRPLDLATKSLSWQYWQQCQWLHSVIRPGKAATKLYFDNEIIK